MVAKASYQGGSAVWAERIGARCFITDGVGDGIQLAHVSEEIGPVVASRVPVLYTTHACSRAPWAG